MMEMTVTKREVDETREQILLDSGAVVDSVTLVQWMSDWTTSMRAEMSVFRHEGQPHRDFFTVSCKVSDYRKWDLVQIKGGEDRFLLVGSTKTGPGTLSLYLPRGALESLAQTIREKLPPTAEELGVEEWGAE